MQRIKTFQFCVSNHGGNRLYRRVDECPDWDKKYPYMEEYEIDAVVNGWISEYAENVIDIRTATYTVHRHNNSYADTVILVYTIVYTPKKKED